MEEGQKSLQEQGVNPELLQGLEQFRHKYQADEGDRERIRKPPVPYYGKDILEMAIAALLQGEHILLVGTKATGKNILAEYLAYLFGRPSFNISFHVNTDSASLIGMETFQNNEVTLRKGPVYQCAVLGGFGIFDEINMAKNDAVSVLHSVLDYRRMMDIPGYNKINLHPAARFIGTMNYGYAGTRELNEALVSRFLVLSMPELTEETLMKLLKESFPYGKEKALSQFCALFFDLQKKSSNGEISSRPIDLRGMIAAIRTMEVGLNPFCAIQMGLTNKTFDIFERKLVEDIVLTRIPPTWKKSDIFYERRVL